MTAKRSSSKKSASTGKATAKKATAKKKVAPKKKTAAKKKSASPKKASSPKTSGKKKVAPQKKTAVKTASAQKVVPAKTIAPAQKIESAKKPAPTLEAPQQQAAARKQTSGVPSSDVMMGHVFSLRPRVITAFKPDDFRRARQLLEDESFSSIDEAARAVAEKALELTQGGPDGVPKLKRF